MKIGIVTRKNGIDDIVVENLITILKQNSAEVYFSEESKKRFSGECLCAEEFYKTVDIIIVLGGDGTLLQVAKHASEYDIPILGMNYGRIGLLTDLEKEDMHLVKKIFTGEYVIDERMMLTATVTEQGVEQYCFHALNDVVISRGNCVKMLDMQLYIDNELCTEIRADGLIVATPTGSTAYSLSAGGSVIDPAAEVFAVTPICPHTLKSRPLIIYKNRQIRIKQKNITDEYTHLSCDGAEAVAIPQEMDIRIRIAEKKTKLIRILNRNFYSVLKDKL